MDDDKQGAVSVANQVRESLRTPFYLLGHAAACEQIGRWLRWPVGPVHVAVNVADRQFVEGDVIEAVAANDIPANLLELELTQGLVDGEHRAHHRELGQPQPRCGPSLLRKAWVPTALRSDIHDAFRHYWRLHDVREERRELELAAVMSTVPPPRSLR
jgi:hypothetical protein